MKALLDRRVIAAGGAAVALLAAVLLGLVVFHDRKTAAPKATAAGAGLQIEQGAADAGSASTKPLRCFVGGQFVGMATVSQCAQKNGVAAQALDVGLDPVTGQVTAPSGTLAPPVQEPPPAPGNAQGADAEQAAAPEAATGECLRYGPDGWKGAGSGIALNQCVRTLFDGRCDRPGEALYGRWGSDTLRLAPGRVEISPDNRNFRPLVSQNPQDCSIASE